MARGGFSSDLCGAGAKHCAAGLCLALAGVQGEGAFHQAERRSTCSRRNTATTSRPARCSISSPRRPAVPADTVTSGWASQLVDTSIQDFFTALMPNSVYPALGGKGREILLRPRRHCQHADAGEHADDRRFSSSPRARRFRCGKVRSRRLPSPRRRWRVISTFTREIAEHSTPAIDALIRQAIIEDTAVAIDSVLLDAIAATTTRPAGLKAGVSATTATAGGGLRR